MIDRLFTAALTFCLLAAGTLAIGSAWFEPASTARSAAPLPVLQLPAVQVHVVQLPRIEMVGKRLEPVTELARTDSTEPSVRNVQ